MTRTVNDSMNQETSQIHTAYLTYSTNALYKKVFASILRTMSVTFKSFFVNHDLIEIADFIVAGAFAIQLLFAPEIFLKFALSNAASSSLPHLVLLCRIAGLFLFSERTSFYFLISTGDAKHKSLTSALSFIVWACTARLFLKNKALYVRCRCIVYL